MQRFSMSSMQRASRATSGSLYVRLAVARAFLSSSAAAAGEKKYDVVVIGGGPGGYVAAIKGAQLGLKVACVEKRGALGGTCLNVGCIPSKALLHISHQYHEATHRFAAYGIKADVHGIDVAQMMKQKTKAVKGLTQGIEGLFKKNGVEYIKGFGALTGGANEVVVDLADGSGKRVLATERVVVATGSEPTSVPGVTIDEKRVVSSTGALELTEVPKRLVVIGAGVIGLELGSVWSRLGSEVQVVEYLDRITPSVDKQVAQALQRELTKQGLKFSLSTAVKSATVQGNEVRLVTAPSKGGDTSEVVADVVLVATGRRPFTDNLGLEKHGVEMEGRFIRVDKHSWRTNVPWVYAIGDVTTGPMLAHKAEEEGVAVMEHIATGAGHVNYGAIPSVIYTHPEIASVGANEEELAAAGIKYKVGSFPMMANSRARTNDDAAGLVKVIVDETDRLLGVHIMSTNAGELIGEATLGLEYGASSEDLARTCHAHPTLSEAVKEACLAAFFKPIHM